MRHDFLDRYSRIDSIVHRIPVVIKLFTALTVVIVIISTPHFLPSFFISIAFFLVFVALLSKIPPIFILKRLLFLESLILGIAILTLFQPNGIGTFVIIVVKSTLCLLTMVLFSNTTPFSDLLQMLKRACLPALLVSILALMYRYLFVLIDETERMTRARTSRTFSHKRAPVWRSLGTIIGLLFIRSTERAERIYAAMCARGWK